MPAAMAVVTDWITSTAFSPTAWAPRMSSRRRSAMSLRKPRSRSSITARSRSAYGTVATTHSVSRSRASASVSPTPGVVGVGEAARREEVVRRAAVRAEDGVLGRGLALELRRLHEHVPAVRVARRRRCAARRCGSTGRRASTDRTISMPARSSPRSSTSAGQPVAMITTSKSAEALAPPSRQVSAMPPSAARARRSTPSMPGADVDALVDERGGDLLRDRLVGGHQHARREVEQRHGRAERAEDGRELRAGVAGADHRDAARQRRAGRSTCSGTVASSAPGIGSRREWPPTQMMIAPRGDPAAAVEREGAVVLEPRPALLDQFDARLREPLRLLA